MKKLILVGLLVFLGIFGFSQTVLQDFDSDASGMNNATNDNSPAYANAYASFSIDADAGDAGSGDGACHVSDGGYCNGWFFVGNNAITSAGKWEVTVKVKVVETDSDTPFGPNSWGNGYGIGASAKQIINPDVIEKDTTFDGSKTSNYEWVPNLTTGNDTGLGFQTVTVDFVSTSDLSYPRDVYIYGSVDIDNDFNGPSWGSAYILLDDITIQQLSTPIDDWCLY